MRHCVARDHLRGGEGPSNMLIYLSFQASAGPLLANRGPTHP